jgi:hypothetical protein
MFLVILNSPIQFKHDAFEILISYRGNGAEISIRQTVVYNGFIYAATNNGIRERLFQ